tara:strand:- start:1854 stop:2780 length:927 start_codon:yes stop_codon:yes gene_type:complete
MNFQEIYNLSQFIPRDSIYFDRFIDDSESNNAFEVNRFTFCYSDLKFGWHFIKSHNAANLTLGSYVTNESLIRAYNFERYKTPDRDVAYAIALETTMPKYFKNLITSLCFSPGMDYQKISDIVKVPKEVIKIYEQLFYNILDRREEAAFIAEQIYPESRAEEFKPDYMDNVPYDTLMKRSGYNNSIEDLLYLAGFRESDVFDGGAQNLQEESTRLETAIMNNANYLVKAGMINSRNVVGIASAKNLLAAAKHGGAEETAEVGVGLSPMGSVIMTEVLRDHETVLEERLKHTQEFREAELVKTEALESS